MLDFLFGEKRIKVINKEKEEHQTTFILPKVTRVEVINHEASLKYPPGRVYTNMNCKDVELQYQDNNCTLKVFIK